jgi:hypothetical protein
MAQLNLFEDEPPNMLTPLGAKESPGHVEILPPVHKSSPEIALAKEVSSAPTEGQLENQYLWHQADKYEDRCFRTVIVFFIASCLVVCSKAGLKIPNATLESHGLPVLDNARLLTGMLGAITVITAFVVVYYALRTLQHRPQLRLRLPAPSPAGRVAQVMFGSAVLLLIAMFTVAVYLSFIDILFMSTYLIDHILYTLDGWDPQ